MSIESWFFTAPIVPTGWASASPNSRLSGCGAVELIYAKAVNLPMLERMFKEYPPGKAPESLQQLASKIRDADGFVLVAGDREQRDCAPSAINLHRSPASRS